MKEDNGKYVLEFETADEVNEFMAKHNKEWRIVGLKHNNYVLQRLVRARK